MYFIYLFGVLRRFQHCTDHITTGSWKSRGNQYIQFVRVLYCKLPANGKQLPAFPLETMPGTEPRPQVGGESVTTLPLWPLLKDVIPLFTSTVIKRVVHSVHKVVKRPSFGVTWRHKVS